MSENVQIALIVVVGVVILFSIALVVFKDKITSFKFKASKNGVNAEMKGDKKAVFSNNVLHGIDNEINTNTENVTLENNSQIGKGNKININVGNKKK